MKSKKDQLPDVSVMTNIVLNAIKALPEDQQFLFYIIFKQKPELLPELSLNTFNMIEQGKSDQEINDYVSDFMQKSFMDVFGYGLDMLAPKTRKSKVKRNPAPKHEITLTLKIQLKSVIKPPCWRQIQVSGNYTFLQLHNIIQILFGLDDDHLWMFQEKAYHSDICIGVPRNKDGYGLDDATNSAARTKLSKFLNTAGDSLEYVYDFGNDWIFTVTVKDVSLTPVDHPVCTKFKCDVQCIDFISPCYYDEVRNLFANHKSMTDDQLCKYAERLDFLDVEDMLYNFDNLSFDLASVNERLKHVPNKILTY